MQELLKKMRDLLAERNTLRTKGNTPNDFLRIQRIEAEMFAYLPKILDELERRM